MEIVRTVESTAPEAESEFRLVQRHDCSAFLVPQTIVLQEIVGAVKGPAAHGDEPTIAKCPGIHPMNLTPELREPNHQVVLPKASEKNNAKKPKTPTRRRRRGKVDGVFVVISET